MMKASFGRLFLFCSFLSVTARPVNNWYFYIWLSKSILMSDFLDQSVDQTPKKRPVFLTVLCILTFVSCGFGLLSSGFGLLAGGQMQKQQLQTQRMMDRLQRDQDTPEIFDSMVESTQKMQKWNSFNQLMSLGNVVICFAGAMLMWRLKKPGYFIYIAGQILPLISLFMMYSVMQNIPIMGTAMLIVGVFSAIFAIGFSVMYGLNLKHMH